MSESQTVGVFLICLGQSACERPATRSLVCRYALHLSQVWPPPDRPSQARWARDQSDQILVQRCSCRMDLGSISIPLPKLVGLRRSLARDLAYSGHEAFGRNQFEVCSSDRDQQSARELSL